jgi:hypothetical protein
MADREFFWTCPELSISPFLEGAKKFVPFRRQKSLLLGMNNPTPPTDAPIPFTNKAERVALVLEFQRITARLAQAKLISLDASTRLMRMVNRERRAADERRNELSELIFQILRGIEDGVLKEGEHIMLLDGDRVALHLASLAPALVQAKRITLPLADLRSLINLGWQQFRGVLLARTERVFFNREGDRRRAVILHVPSAYKFVGAIPKPVPSR